MKKTSALILSLIIAVMMSFTALAANPVSASEDWLNANSDFASDSGKIAMLPGCDGSSRVFSWLSSEKNDMFFFGTDINNLTVVKVCTQLSPMYGYKNTVYLSALEDGIYYYSFINDGSQYGPYKFKIDTDNTFSVMYCSDPQLGRSGDNTEQAVADDAYGWARTLAAAEKFDIEYVLCAGDQVNKGSSRFQYNALLAPEELKGIALAAAAGNHDFSSSLYNTYFGESGEACCGNDYYFSCGNALFIVLDSNYVSTLTHESTIKQAVSAYPDAQWRIVTMHHSTYSVLADEFTNNLCTVGLADIFNANEIDLVLSGHDHTYSRTFNDIDSGTALYLQTGSASGGKCRNYSAETVSYIENNIDCSEAMFTIMDFDGSTLTLTTYGTDSGEVLDCFTMESDEEKDNSTGNAFLDMIIDFISAVISRIKSLFSGIC